MVLNLSAIREIFNIVAPKLINYYQDNISVVHPFVTIVQYLNCIEDVMKFMLEEGPVKPHRFRY